MDVVIIFEDIFCKDNPVAKLIEGFPRIKEEEVNNERAAKKTGLQVV